MLFRVNVSLIPILKYALYPIRHCYLLSIDDSCNEMKSIDNVQNTEYFQSDVFPLL